MRKRVGKSEAILALIVVSASRMVSLSNYIVFDVCLMKSSVVYAAI